MLIDPAILKATADISSCPHCGGKHYAVSNRVEEGGLKCESVTCLDCGFDILEAYRDAQARKN
jgi:transposase